MLNRRVLRMKVMQVLYAYLRQETKDLIKAEKTLLLSLDRLYDLYIYFLYFPVLLKDIAELRLEDAKNKKLPLEEDLNPNLKFISSPLIQLIEEDTYLNKEIERRNIRQQIENNELRVFFRKYIVTSEVYKAYMSTGETSLDEDTKFFISLYRQVLPKAEIIFNTFNEKSIYWDTNDIDYALSNVIKTFKSSGNKKELEVLPLYKDKKEDLSFVKELFRKTANLKEEYNKDIIDRTKNWDTDRIAVIDLLLMKMAVIEFVNFPSIPVKVTLNEYIELSKWYSSPKSKLFINGILNKILEDYKKQNKIKKTGRGLLEQ